MLRVYLAFTDGRLGQDLTPEDRFYNRYFWFRRFANAYQKKFGDDAGIEQQSFQILDMWSAILTGWTLNDWILPGPPFQRYQMIGRAVGWQKWEFFVPASLALIRSRK